MPDLTWANVRIRLDELDPWPRNPRQIRADQAKRLGESYDEFGEVEPIAIGPRREDGKCPLYNGHQRYHVLQAKHGGAFQVDARQSSRALTEKEREKLTVFLHKGAAGEWNMDALAEWDMPDLLEWGFSEAELTGVTGPLPEFKEYDESVADDVEYVTCPECGHKFPK